MIAMIEIKEDQIKKAVSAAYDLSRPVGLGFLHAISGPLPEDELNELTKFDGSNCICLDYVHGRAVKFNIIRKTIEGETKYFISGKWFDHTEKDLNTLLDLIGA